MPFQYVWQYQNTETTVLAQDIVDIINANNLLPFDCSQCSGGGAVNAAGYIPVSDGLVFNNSWLYQTATAMKTMWIPDPGDVIWGMEFNYSTKDVLLGSYMAGFQTNTQFGISSIYAVDPIGPVGNLVQLNFEAPNQLIKTEFGVNGDNVGFRLDFANGLYAFGEYAGIGNVPQLKVDTTNAMVDMTLDGNGINIFKLGLDVDGIVLDADQSITSGGLSGSYVALKVNGIDYKLALYLL
jgi:hypothetical protein